MFDVSYLNWENVCNFYFYKIDNTILNISKIKNWYIWKIVFSIFIFYIHLLTQTHKKIIKIIN
jgi:hypothetical protein